MCWTCFLLLCSVSPLKWALGNRWTTCQRNSGYSSNQEPLTQPEHLGAVLWSGLCWRICIRPSLFSIDNKIEQKTQMMQRSSQQLWGWESQGFRCAGKFFLTSLVCFIPRWAQVWTWSWKHDLLSKLSPLFIRWYCGNQHINTTWHVRNLRSAADRLWFT